MILLITTSPRAEECRAGLQKACGEPVDYVARLSAALSRLRQNEYSMVIIDQNLVDPDPQASELLLCHVGTAAPVYINFAVSSTERIIREIQVAHRRLQMERSIARSSEISVLRNELKDSLTGILLSSQLALTMAALPPEAQAKIRSVCELAEGMRQRLETSGQ